LDPFVGFAGWREGIARNKYKTKSKEQVQNEERGTNPEDLFFEFTPGIKIRNNCLWRYIYM
jgi:hypothetical protein